jgi:hypothetical protein
MTGEETAAAETAADAADDAAATLRVVRGEPTPEELAALVAVLVTRAGAHGEPANPAKTSDWTDRSRYVRSHTPHTSGGWRASAFPR